MTVTNFPATYRRLVDGFSELHDALPEQMAGFSKLNRSAVAEGALSTRTKELMALAIGIASRCDGCIAFHVRNALRAGATRPEIAETVGVAILMGGGPAAVYATEAFEALNQFEAAQQLDAPAPGVRTVELGEGRTLTVRPAEPGDLDGLAALYAGLSRDDTHLRFFSAYTPTREFLERWAANVPGGGCTLVAVVEGGEGGDGEDGGEERTRLVADAGYSRLDNGNGELAVTVAADWRGWLAPFLLDALLEEAAARGVPNLEAELVADNRPMLSLVRARGYAVVEHPEWTILRVTIATQGRTPSWPRTHDRPRVLVEGTSHWRAEADAMAAGIDVLACPGPRGRPGGRCPLLDGGTCPLVDGADAVVVSTRGEPATALRDAHASQGTPVVIDGEPGPSGLTEHERAVPVCSTAGELIAVVAEVAARRRAGSPPPQ